MLGLGLLLFLKLLSLAFILYSVAASFPQISSSKQKSWQRMQSFPTQLVRFLFFFTDVNVIPACLVCSQQGSVVNKFTFDASMRLIMTRDAWRDHSLTSLTHHSLTRNTVAERISDISANLDSQQKNKVKSFVVFSVALDESTDIWDVAQLAISFVALMRLCPSLRNSWGWCLW